MDLKRVQQQLKFIFEIDKEKEIYGQTHITGYKPAKKFSDWFKIHLGIYK